MRLGFWRASISVAVAALLVSAWALGASPRPTSAASSEDFFIVSSIDASQKRLVLKRPSEVTLIVRVTDGTSYRSEHNKPLKLSDLRAGDTIFVRLGSGNAADVALSIRRGPMTLEELRRRYLRSR